MNTDDAHDIRLDARALRVLAHPLRTRILGLLRMMGEATATELAERLGTNTGATSYHVRALAEVGLVVDTGTGVGKRRVWAPSSSHHSWASADFADDPDSKAAVDWLQRAYLREFTERAERWEDEAPSWPREWTDELGLSDTWVEVDPAQLGRLRAELGALLEQYRDVGAGDPAARRIHVTTHFAPLSVSVDSGLASGRVLAAADDAAASAADAGEADADDAPHGTAR